MKQGRSAHATSPDQLITFDEKEVEPIVGTVPESAKQAAIDAESFATGLAGQIGAASIRHCDTAIAGLEDYVRNRLGSSIAAEYVAEPTSNGVQAAVAVLCQFIPILGPLAEHGFLAIATSKAVQNPLDVTAYLKFELRKLLDQTGDFVPVLLADHRDVIREAWTNADGDVELKRAAVTRALAEIGIQNPPRDASQKIYEGLVATLGIDLFISACREGRLGRTADCATDADVPKIKRAAHVEAEEAFQKKSAIPRR